MRNEAYKSLVIMGSKAVASITALLNGENDSVRYYAVGLLADIGDPIAVEPILTLLTDEDEEIRAEAVHALGELGDVRAVVPLLAVLQDKSEGSWARSYAARALGNLGDPRSVGPLIEAIVNDRNGSVRVGAARARGMLGDPRAVDPLIQSLTADIRSLEEVDIATELELVWYSAWSLAQLRDPRAVEPLIELLLKGPSNSIERFLAIDALGAFADERALAPLEWIQKHERPDEETTAASFDRDIAKAIMRIKQRQLG